MRRMKIRAKPNFGGGGGTGAAPRNTSGPVQAARSNEESVEPQSSQTQITSSPLEEDVVCTSTVTDTGQPSGESVEVTSGVQDISSSAISVDLQEDTNKPRDNATTSAASQINTSHPNITNVQKIKSFSVTDAGDEVQEVTNTKSESGVTVSPKIESMVTAGMSKSNPITVPKRQTQPLSVPQDNSAATTSQIISQSITQTRADVKCDVNVSHYNVVSPMSDPSSSVPKEAQQDSDGKSAVCMRRKKLKVKPMLGIVRKGGATDKAKMKASDNITNALNIKREFVDTKALVNQAVSGGNVNSPENVENDHLNQKVQETVAIDTDAGNVSKKSDKKSVVQTGANEETNVIPKCSESSEICSIEKEMLQVRQEMKTEMVCKKIEMEVIKDNTNTTIVVNQTPDPVETNVAPKPMTDSSAPMAGYKRRARIRAKPTLITKKRKDEDKVVAAKPVVEQIPTTAESVTAAPPQESAARGSGSAEPDAAVVMLTTESSDSQQKDGCRPKHNITTFKKEVRFADTETNIKHSHIPNLTDNNKDSMESEQTMKREGILASFKEKAESPLHSNLKTPRKKKLSENQEIDPELEVLDANATAEKQAKKRLKQDQCEEVMNSDDSTGDKENASTTVTELPKQERTIKDNNTSVITQKARTKSPVHGSKLFGKYERKFKIEEEGDSPDKKKQQVFRARKDEFRKKLSEGPMEHSKMTMFDLIYWNPASNPMPSRGSSPRRSPSKGDTDSITSEAAEEQRVDDLGLDPAEFEQQSRPESPQVTDISEAVPEKPDEENKTAIDEEKCHGEDSATNEEEPPAEKDIFAPRVKIGPNGEIMVDEQSIKIQTTAAKNRDEVLSKAVVVEESGDSSHYGKWSKRRRRSCEWTVKETALFYKALSTVGTDFSLMATLIKWRTRAELKTKFKKEERNNRELVDLALNDSTQFDMTVFEEESDYDPKEDRKAARQAERAEAKRKRMEMKQQDKIKEMEKKKLIVKNKKAQIKKHKKVLRKAFKNRGKKRKVTFESDNEDSPVLDDSDTASEESVLEPPQPEDLVPVKPRVMVKRRQAKRRNSLVISEVTVTMETVKYDQSADEAMSKQTVKEHEASPENITHSSMAETNITDHCIPHEETHPTKSPDNIIPHTSDELSQREEQENEMNLLNEYPQLPLNEGLPETNIIEDILSEEDEIVDVENVTDTSLIANANNSKPTTSINEGCTDSGSADTVTNLQPSNPPPDPPPPEATNDDDGQRVWHFPVSAIQTLEDGRQVIVVPTPNGYNSVPVPILPEGTSNVVVMATDVPDCPGELIYHVYVVSPVEGGES